MKFKLFRTLRKRRKKLKFASVAESLQNRQVVLNTFNFDYYYYYYFFWGGAPISTQYGLVA